MFKVVLLLLIPMLVVANYTGSAATFDDYIKRIYNDNVFNKEQKTQLKFILKEAIHEQKLERLKLAKQQREKAQLQRLKQIEKENSIIRELLASKVKGSFMSDFQTMRYK